MLIKNKKSSWIFHPVEMNYTICSKLFFIISLIFEIIKIFVLCIVLVICYPLDVLYNIVKYINYKEKENGQDRQARNRR